MIGARSASTPSAVSGDAAGSSVCIRPSLRMIGGLPTQRCRSDALSAHIARKRSSIAATSLMINGLVGFDDVRHVHEERAGVGFHIPEHLRASGPVAETILRPRAMDPHRSDEAAAV